MKKALSIKQNDLPDALPNFRNLGVTLRILLFSNGMGLLLALLQANSWAEVPQHLMQIAALLTPILLSCLLLLWAMQRWLHQLEYRRGVLAVNILVMSLTLLIYHFGQTLYQPDADTNLFELRYLLLSMLACSMLLMYFRWRSQVLSRALHEARLQVLRARIRPHFLFNSINAVLGIVRADPKKAESALEDMADLFRMAMSEAHDLVPLHKEIELCKQYLALEQLRMGERLRVDWQILNMPDDALIPPLLLQPLLENAVYHGIEPLPQGGSISVVMQCRGDELRLSIENPCAGKAPHAGHEMALQNIRERLALLFDVEARYQVESGADFYRVQIALPLMKEKHS
jgi:two-component system, LytTR family, sensor histidine kinase AlgZ